MLIGGLWHGAAWTFVIWGGLHGLYLIIERLIKKIPTLFIWFPKPLTYIFGWSMTLFLVIYSWVWFRSASINQAIDITKNMFLVDPENLLSSLSQMTF